MARSMVYVKGEGAEALARARFLPDAFSAAAFVLGPIWLFAKGAWIAALLLIALQIAIGAGLNALGAAHVAPLVTLAISFLMGLESGVILGWELGLKGYRLAGLVSGDDREVIERRFYEAALNGSAAAPSPWPIPTAPPSPAAAAARSANGMPVIGLFPEPGRPGGSAR